MTKGIHRIKLQYYMASFGLDIGHGRSICVEANSKGVHINTYSTLPSSQIVKVSAKSIFLSLPLWKKFNDNLTEITTNFNTLTNDESSIRSDFKLHLGKNYYIRAVSDISCVHIRKYYFNKEECALKPGRPGIAFKFPEFRELLNNLSSINDITCIDSIESCCITSTQKDCKVCSE